jgi:hypothetical protein
MEETSLRRGLVDRERLTDELRLILKAPDRNFEEEPITIAESYELIETFYEMIGDPKTSDELAEFLLTCVNVIKQYITYN